MKYLSRAKRLGIAVDSLEDVCSELRGIAESIKIDSDQKLAEATEALGKVDSSEFETLRDEISEWRDNIEGSFSQTQKFSDLEECASTLDEIVSMVEAIQEDILGADEIEDKISDLEDAINECGNVNFPGMYG